MSLKNLHTKYMQKMLKFVQKQAKMPNIALQVKNCVKKITQHLKFSLGRHRHTTLFRFLEGVVIGRTGRRKHTDIDLSNIWWSVRFYTSH